MKRRHPTTISIAIVGDVEMDKYDSLQSKLDKLVQNYHPQIHEIQGRKYKGPIINIGDWTGTGKVAYWWASQCRYVIQRFHEDWEHNAATRIRDKEMIRASDWLIVFLDKTTITNRYLEGLANLALERNRRVSIVHLKEQQPLRSIDLWLYSRHEVTP